MIALEIADIRDFTSKLFLNETFDSFELVDAEFFTRIHVQLDGHLTEPDKGQRYTEWSQCRPLAFSVIKGKQLPHSFQITLRLSDENTTHTLQSIGLPYTLSDIGGLFLNIRYNQKKLHVVTGCSFQTFTLDKTLEQEWDKIVCRFLRHHQIPFQDMA